MSQLPLFTRFPALQNRIAHIPLCELPTPIDEADALARELGVGKLLIKRDDLSARPYGGNKARKLEFLLAEAKRRGHEHVLTFGYAGSNHAAATAWYARQHSMRSISMLLPQANAAYVRENLLISHAAGAEFHLAANEFLLGLKTLTTTLRHALRGQRPYWIPAGGSSPLGLLGFVNAAFELAEQIKAGLCEKPDAIYLPLGSMGSVAGLAIGMAATGLNIPIQAVRVVPEKFGNAEALDKLIRQTSRFLRARCDSFPDTRQAATLCTVRNEFYGAGYGVKEAGIQQVIDRSHAAAGLELDITYSGKAMAALFADAESGSNSNKTVLFWNTHNSLDTSALIDGVDYRGLPAVLHPYFQNAG